jgi:hypothetical protein
VKFVGILMVAAGALGIMFTIRKPPAVKGAS